MAKGYEISDSKWEQIANLFPKSKTGRPAKWDNRTMLNAILWLARSGSAWEDIPNRYPPHQSVYSRFCKWRDDGTLETIFHALNVDADLENLSIDSTCVKAHPQSAGAKKGLSIQNFICLSVQVVVKRTPRFMPLLMDWGILFHFCCLVVKFMTVRWQLLCLRQ